MVTYFKRDMEQDRYQYNHGRYLIAFASLMLGLFCIATVIYLLPFALFKVVYGLPLFFFQWVNYIKEFFDITDSDAVWAIWGSVFILGLISLLCADLISNQIDKNLLDQQDALPIQIIEPKNREGVRTGLVIVLVIMLALAFIKIFEWSISSPTP